MSIFKNLVVFIALILVISACTKKEGVTTSKIKIIGGKAFANALSTKANNGLVLYGKSNDGKSFTKVIDSDTFEMIFPNGTWNFYAIAWQYATPSSATGFMGTVSCGKSLGVQLNGTDASISMMLDNANCDGAIHPDSDLVSGVKKLPAFNLYSCKDLSTVAAANNGSNCSKANNNKGYATYVKVFIPEHRQFNQAGDGVTGSGIFSKCFEIDSATNAAGLATSESSIASSLNLPLPGINGMVVGVRTYYSSSTCDDNFGFDNFFWKEGQVSTKLKRFTDHSGGAGTQAIENYFIQTDPIDVCRPPRLAPTTFASGRGTAFLPYGICTPEQLKLMKTDFTSGYITKDKSFDLLANLNFNFTEFQPIGDDTTTNATPTNFFTGNFSGNKFRIDNLLIKCKNLFSTNGMSVGLFRATNGSTISDLTMNKVAVACDDDSREYGDVGALVGTSQNTTYKNIKIFGYVGGGVDVGGVTGYFSGGTTAGFTDVHVQAHVEGKRFVGGIVGYGNAIATAANQLVIFRSSFKGDVRGRLKGNFTGTVSSEAGAGSGVLGDYKQVDTVFTLTAGASLAVGDYIYWDVDAVKWRRLGNSTGGDLPVDSYVGGIGGKLNSSNIARISEVKVDLDRMEASRVFGGVAGGLSSVSIDNSYVTGYMENSGELDGTVGGTGFSKVGGLVGVTTSGTFNNNIVQVLKEIKTKPADTTNKGLIGSNGSSTCTDNRYMAPADNDSCQSVGNLSGSAIYAFASYPSSFNFASSTSWNWGTVDQGNDIPRLIWEINKENEVPYLKRLCSNLWAEANRTGTGDTASSPRSVCNMSQLLNMTAGKYYELKKNIFHDGTNLSTVMASGKIPAGKYFLNGNNFTIGNFFVSANTPRNGLFESLAAGSEIKNLKILKGFVSGSGQTISSGVYLNGILAAENFGIIKNVQIDNSAVNIMNLTVNGTGTAYIGGAVGKNYSGAVIEDLENNANVMIDQPIINSGSIFKVGGLAAFNGGAIKIVRNNSEVVRKVGEFGGESVTTLPGCATLDSGRYVYYTVDSTIRRCNGSSFVDVTNTGMSSGETWAGFVADNAGSIDEVEQEGSLRIRDVLANTNGKISPFIATLSSSSVMRDIYFRGWLENYRAPIANFFDSFAGSLSRMILRFDSSNGVNFSTSGSIIPASGPVETICIKGASFPDCHNNAMTYEFTSANGLTFKESGSAISGFQYLTGWNIGGGFIPDMTKTWRMENPSSSTEPPELVRTGGDFIKIGAGF